VILATPEQERELIALLPGADLMKASLGFLRRWVNNQDEVEADGIVKFLKQQQ
jgi:hypothetical protein